MARGQSLLIDDSLIAIAENHPDTLPLAPLALDPGRHTVSLDDQQLTLTLVPFVRATATHGTASFPLVEVAGRCVLGPFSRDADTVAALRGAVLNSDDVEGRPVVARIPPNAALYVLTEDGHLYAASRGAPSWVQRVGLQPCYLDALEVTEGIPGAPAFLIYRASRRVHALELPPTSAMRRSHGVAPTPTKAPDLIAQLIADPPAVGHRRRSAARRLGQGSDPADKPPPHDAAQSTCGSRTRRRESPAGTGLSSRLSLRRPVDLDQ